MFPNSNNCHYYHAIFFKNCNVLDHLIIIFDIDCIKQANSTNAQEARWQSGVRSCIIPVLPIRLVQEINVGTVHVLTSSVIFVDTICPVTATLDAAVALAMVPTAVVCSRSVPVIGAAPTVTLVAILKTLNARGGHLGI